MTDIPSWRDQWAERLEAMADGEFYRAPPSEIKVAPDVLLALRAWADETAWDSDPKVVTPLSFRGVKLTVDHDLEPGKWEVVAP